MVISLFFNDLNDFRESAITMTNMMINDAFHSGKIFTWNSNFPL
jgi:hypothetical protein